MGSRDHSLKEEGWLAHWRHRLVGPLLAGPVCKYVITHAPCHVLLTHPTYTTQPQIKHRKAQKSSAYSASLSSQLPKSMSWSGRLAKVAIDAAAEERQLNKTLEMQPVRLEENGNSTLLEGDGINMVEEETSEEEEEHQLHLGQELGAKPGEGRIPSSTHLKVGSLEDGEESEEEEIGQLEEGAPQDWDEVELC
jgi:hypothetical protein